MSAREHPEWMYSVPDARTAHIAELEAEAVMLRAMLDTMKEKLARREKTTPESQAEGPEEA